MTLRKTWSLFPKKTDHCLDETVRAVPSIKPRGFNLHVTADLVYCWLLFGIAFHCLAQEIILSNSSQTYRITFQTVYSAKRVNPLKKKSVNSKPLIANKGWQIRVRNHVCSALFMYKLWLIMSDAILLKHEALVTMSFNRTIHMLN